jgi:hypothetical protein
VFIIFLRLSAKKDKAFRKFYKQAIKYNKKI